MELGRLFGRRLPACLGRFAGDLTALFAGELFGPCRTTFKPTHSTERDCGWILVADLNARDLGDNSGRDLVNVLA